LANIGQAFPNITESFPNIGKPFLNIGKCRFKAEKCPFGLKMDIVGSFPYKLRGIQPVAGFA